MKSLVTTLFATALMTGGIGFSSLAMADSHGGHHGGHHGHGHGYNKAWMEGLSDEQRKQIDKLHEDYYKQKRSIKDKIKDAKHELAKVITTDNPKQKDIDKSIDAILKLKREKMSLKAAHKIEVRKLLNKEQRVKFDEHVLNKGKHCRKYKRHHN